MISFSQLTGTEEAKLWKIVFNVIIYLCKMLSCQISKKIILCFVVVLHFSSCVTNKKYVMMQKNDVNAKELPKDSIVRTYDLPDFDYRIQPEDIISVRFESLTPQEYDIFNRNMMAQQAQNMNLSGNALMIGELVDPAGEIFYPVIGKVKVAGFTVFELQEKLQKLADQYLESPIVRVRLINFRFTLLGEANREGTVVLQNNRVNLLEAIGFAGGLKDLADKKNIKLIRQINGKTEIRYVDLLDENLIAKPEYFIHQNDILIVPALRQRPYRQYFGQNLSLALSSVSVLLITLSLINSGN
jgi:polysaccharide biosynthesis/export protein